MQCTAIKGIGATQREGSLKIHAMAGWILSAGVATAAAEAVAPPVEPGKDAPPAAVMPAPVAPAPPAFEFALHGFVSGSLFMQDSPTGINSGQDALWASGRYDTDKLVLGGDVRQTRLNFSVKGPQVLGGATPKGVVEADFF